MRSRSKMKTSAARTRLPGDAWPCLARYDQDHLARIALPALLLAGVTQAMKVAPGEAED